MRSEACQHSGDPRGKVLGHFGGQRVDREPAHVFALVTCREVGVRRSKSDESHIPVRGARKAAVQLVTVEVDDCIGAKGEFWDARLLTRFA